MAGHSFAPPAAISGLGADTERRVGELVREAERRQIREGMEALDSALGLVPRPLRPMIRKVVGA